MRTFFALAAVALLLGSAHAQSCFGQLPSVQPAMSCPNPTSLCLCGPTGANCHWEWVCPSPTAATPWGASAPQAGSSIPLQIKPPVFANPLELMLEIQELRNLQFQQQIERERLQQQQLPPSPQVEPCPAAPTAASAAAHPKNVTFPETAPFGPPAVHERKFVPPAMPDEDNGPTETRGLSNGRWWRMLAQQASPELKFSFLLGVMDGLSQVSGAAFVAPLRSTRLEIAKALDAFYENAEDRTIPVVGALVVLRMKEAGQPQSAIDEEMSALRRMEH